MESGELDKHMVIYETFVNLHKKVWKKKKARRIGSYIEIIKLKK